MPAVDLPKTESPAEMPGSGISGSGGELISRPTMRLIIISGLSGAGKTVALKQYEDLGFYCIDNLPLGLVQPLIAHALERGTPRYDRLALGVDARGDPREIESFPGVVDALAAQGVNIRVVFLTAEDEVILRRYHETRHKHPLSSAEVPLLEAIRLERQLLRPISNMAHDALDTSAMNLYELRAAILAHLPDAAACTGMTVQLLSFGYKNGIPEGADFVFDARCLPNPHWVPALRALSGRDAPVASYLEANAEVGDFFTDVRDFLGRWLPKLKAQDRAYVTVAIGCTGGQHRSVYLVERMARDFRERHDSVSVKHRELDP